MRWGNADTTKTKEQHLLDEIADLRRQIAELKRGRTCFNCGPGLRELVSEIRGDTNVS